MEVTSVSLDESTERKIDDIMRRTSFDGRSELLRKAVDEMHAGIDTLGTTSDMLDAVIVVKHPREEKGVSEISHRYDSLISTQLHSTLDADSCLEIFHVNGASDTVKEMYKDLHGSRSTESVRVVPQG
nr:MAG: transcriptional regulator NikR, CopG family [Candidatus Nanosalinarum sp. J07AB56]